MKLYHFTSPAHARGIMREGITLGMVPVRMLPNPVLLKGFQWLTTNPIKAQSWNEGCSLPYDRTAYRLTVKIPRSHQGLVLDWLSCGVLLSDPDMFDTLNAFGDPENWRLFQGSIPASWIRQVRAL